MRHVQRRIARTVLLVACVLVGIALAPLVAKALYALVDPGDAVGDWSHRQRVPQRVYSWKLPRPREVDGFATSLVSMLGDNGSRYQDRSPTPWTYSVISDRAHHLSLHELRHNMSSEVTLAKDDLPPLFVEDRDLGAVRTRMGIALGDTIAHVRSVWGPSTIRQIDGNDILAYRVPMEVRNGISFGCDDLQEVTFRGGLVVSIDFFHGC